MLSSCFDFTSAYLSVYVNHDIVSLSVRHVVDVCCLIEDALTNRGWRTRCLGDVVKARAFRCFKATTSLLYPVTFHQMQRSHVSIHVLRQQRYDCLRKIHLYPRNFVIQIFYTSRDVFENSSLSERNHAMHIYVPFTTHVKPIPSCGS